MARDASPLQTELVVPTPADFRAIAICQTCAFTEKLGCEGIQEAQDSCQKAYETYHRKFPRKLEHCRVIRSPSNGSVMAACQLQLVEDPGDLTFPETMQHCIRPGEVYLEWIACHPDHVGKGLGSQLLKWAESFATDVAKANILTLQVMKANDGAVRLYERKGFVVKRDPLLDDVCDEICGSLFTFCFLGCRYWTILYMEKQLTKSESSTPATQDMNR